MDARSNILTLFSRSLNEKKTNIINTIDFIVFNTQLNRKNVTNLHKEIDFIVHNESNILKKDELCEITMSFDMSFVIDTFRSCKKQKSIMSLNSILASKDSKDPNKIIFPFAMYCDAKKSLTVNGTNYLQCLNRTFLVLQFINTIFEQEDEQQQKHGQIDKTKHGNSMTNIKEQHTDIVFGCLDGIQEISKLYNGKHENLTRNINKIMKHVHSLMKTHKTLNNCEKFGNILNMENKEKLMEKIESFHQFDIDLNDTIQDLLKTMECLDNTNVYMLFTNNMYLSQRYNHVTNSRTSHLINALKKENHSNVDQGYLKLYMIKKVLKVFLKEGTSKLNANCMMLYDGLFDLIDNLCNITIEDAQMKHGKSMPTFIKDEDCVGQPTTITSIYHEDEEDVSYKINVIIENMKQCANEKDDRNNVIFYMSLLNRYDVLCQIIKRKNEILKKVKTDKNIKVLSELLKYKVEMNPNFWVYNYSITNKSLPNVLFISSPLGLSCKRSIIQDKIRFSSIEVFNTLQKTIIDDCLNGKNEIVDEVSQLPSKVIEPIEVKSLKPLEYKNGELIRKFSIDYDTDTDSGNDSDSDEYMENDILEDMTQLSNQIESKNVYHEKKSEMIESISIFIKCDENIYSFPDESYIKCVQKVYPSNFKYNEFLKKIQITTPHLGSSLKFYNIISQTNEIMRQYLLDEYSYYRCKHFILIMEKVKEYI